MRGCDILLTWVLIDRVNMQVGFFAIDIKTRPDIPLHSPILGHLSRTLFTINNNLGIVMVSRQLIYIPGKFIAAVQYGTGNNNNNKAFWREWLRSSLIEVDKFWERPVSQSIPKVAELPKYGPCAASSRQTSRSLENDTCFSTQSL